MTAHNGSDKIKYGKNIQYENKGLRKQQYLKNGRDVGLWPIRRPRSERRDKILDETNAQKPKIMIRVRNLRKEYRLEDDTVVALKRINLDIRQGEICCIFGTSGSGKSTLLNQLAGLEKPTFGDVYIRGVPITRLSEKELAAFRQKHIGFVFQSYNLLPFMTAAENVAMPLMFRGEPKRKRMKTAVSILKRVGLANRLKHYPRQMSGGQQQRVGIARAFVAHPDVVFADEPTGNLDSKTTIEVMDMIKKFAISYKQTIVLVTHDPELAKYADRIVTLVDGRIVNDTANEEKIKIPFTGKELSENEKAI